MNSQAAQEFHLTLTPRDPLIARDGRPFGDGLRMRSLDWLYPSVLAGSLRTMLGHAHGGFPDPHTEESKYRDLVARLKEVSIAGPFPQVDGQLCFPAPQDIVVRQNLDKTLEAFAARPVELSAASFADSGCDLPEGLAPALLPDTVGDDFKPARLPAFWSYDRMGQWLANDDGTGFLPKGAGAWPEGFLQAAKKDLRTHVQMDYETGSGKEGMLFQSTGLDVYQFPRASKEVPPGLSSDVLAARVATNAAHAGWLEKLDALHPLGGERRLIHWRRGKPGRGWSCPDAVCHKLAQSEYVRLVLATPALFKKTGWRPDWLLPDAGRKCLAGTIPNAGVQVRLISACLDRWRPISGWGYEPNAQGKFGPKAVRRLVPAGGVYFFKVEAGKAADLADHWLTSVCQDEQDARDGFGLALWGVWRPHDSGSTFTR